MSISECPNQRELALFLLGDLDAYLFAQLDKHVDSCVDCQQRIEQLKEVTATFHHVLEGSQSPRLFDEEVECQNLVDRIQDISHADLPIDLDSPDKTGPYIPEELGPYRILEQLGQGGMGTVYKALHTRLKRHVAIKVLPPQRLKDAKSEARFRREMEVAGALDHPHIVRASDADEQDGIHYLVMDYIDGLDLARILNCHGPVRIADACELICQAASGLQYAHERALIHRDIKPSNLILTQTQASSDSSTVLSRSATVTSPAPAIVKVLDFGLARWHVADLDASELTSADQLMGTLDFMAPEQVTDTNKVDARADIYSLGATLCKLLTGHSPLDCRGEGSRLKKLLKLASTDLPSVGEFHPSLPPQLVEVIDQMLRRDPEKRPATPAAVNKLLQPFSQGADLAALLQVVRDSGNVTAVKPPLRSPSPIGRPARSRMYWTRRLIWIVPAITLCALGVAQFSPIRQLWKKPTQAELSHDSEHQIEQPKARTEAVLAAEPLLAVAPFNEHAARNSQQEWAKYLDVPVEFTNEQRITFRLIPPGEFWMGSSDTEVEALLPQFGDSTHWLNNIRSEAPSHRVRLTTPYYLATTPVTHEQFEQIMGTLPAYFSQSGPGKELVAGLDTRRFPVENMSFDDAIQFCTRLNQKATTQQNGKSEGTGPHESTRLTGYRLPTEAEWEFACRAGTTTRFWSGDTDAELHRVAWTSRRIGPRPNAVGLLPANPFGLYDMHGNIFQLCSDWWTPQYQPDLVAGVTVNPLGPPTGELKVARGGDWSAGEFLARSATRAPHGINLRNYYCGFRVAISVNDYQKWHSK